MAAKPSSSWADDVSDDLDALDSTRLLKDNSGTTYDAIKDHEAGLDRLGEAIRRQKYVATEVATEIDLHNEILEVIDTGITNTTHNIQKNTRNIKLISRKSSTSLLWFIIVILGIVIVLIQLI